MKNIRINYLRIFLFLVVKFSIYLNRRVSVMTGRILEAKDVRFLFADNEASD